MSLIRYVLCVAGLMMMMRPSIARADDARKACAMSYESSQVLEKEGKLRGARVEANSCGAAACPGFIRDACQKLLSDLDAVQPTVVFSVQDASGADLTDVKVELDGQPFLDRLGAEAVPVDPGEHTLRFVRDGAPPLEQHVLIRTAEKNRILRVTFTQASSPSAATVAATPAPAAGQTRGPLWPSLVVGGVGAATVVASVVVGVSGQSSANDLRTSCAPHCSSASVSSVNTRLVASDVLTGVGIAGVAVGAVLFFVRPGGQEGPRATGRVAPTADGVVVSF